MAGPPRVRPRPGTTAATSYPQAAPRRPRSTAWLPPTTTHHLQPPLTTANRFAALATVVIGGDGAKGAGAGGVEQGQAESVAAS